MPFGGFKPSDTPATPTGGGGNPFAAKGKGAPPAGKKAGGKKFGKSAGKKFGRSASKGRR